MIKFVGWTRMDGETGKGGRSERSDALKGGVTWALVQRRWQKTGTDSRGKWNWCVTPPQSLPECPHLSWNLSQVFTLMFGGYLNVEK